MPPARIVSLVPSLTELVFWLGAGDRLVGRTRFCDEPRGLVTAVAEIGGTKDPDTARVVALAPELVIANREENRREDVEALQGAGLTVFLTDPQSVDGALEMITGLGRLLRCEERAADLVEDVTVALAEVSGAATKRVFVPIWKKPLMALGGETYGSDLLARVGGRNVLAERPRYPVVTVDEVRALRPEVILLPDEPYRFRDADARLFGAIAPARAVDGRLLWWYGPRMPAAIRGLAGLVRGA